VAEEILLARATVDGKPNAVVLGDGDGWTVMNGHWWSDDKVTDIVPLTVLDMGTKVALEVAEQIKQRCGFHALAKQIERQQKAWASFLRPEEPTALGAIVRASAPNLDERLWMRGERDQWISLCHGGTAPWRELRDITVVRADGI
jgi:hypothetical protein